MNTRVTIGEVVNNDGEPGLKHALKFKISLFPILLIPLEYISFQDLKKHMQMLLDYRFQLVQMFIVA